jgi:hypothetical protein
MSTLAFAAITSRRLAATPGSSSETAPPAFKPYVDAMAAIVPAEVLAAHATVVGVLSDVAKDAHGHDVTVLGHPNYLKLTFWVLLALSPGLYLVGRLISKQQLRRLDILLALLPPAAFFAWTMLQPTTVLDAVIPQFEVPGRTVVGILAAVVLAPLAALGGFNADKSAPKPK